MAVLVPSLYVLAGAIAYAMLHSLVTPGARRERAVFHAFAAECLFAALAALFTAKMLQATSGAEYVRSLKTNVDCLILTALAFSVFITRYARLTGRAPRVAFAVYASICLILLAVNEARPYGLQYVRFDGITLLRLPWHESIVQGVGRSGPLLYMTMVALDGVIPYAFVVLLSLYRHTRDRAVLWMLAALAGYVPFAVEGALVRLSIIHGVAAGPFGMLIVTAVIGATLAQETKRKLLDSEERLRVLFELSPLGIVLTVDGHYREFNPAFERMTGYSAAELRGKGHRTLTPSEYADEERRQVEELLRTGLFGPYEKEYRRQDGSLIPVRLNGMLSGKGAQRYVWSIVEDISADRRAQAALRESEMRLRTLIEQSPIAISFSRDGITMEVNAQYLAMFGFSSAAEVRQTPLLERIAPSRRAQMQETIERRRSGLPAPMSYETVGLRKDGSEFPLFVSAKRMDLVDGPLTVSFLMDFTERKQADERIRHLAFFDQLTRLPNRELLADRLHQALATSARTGHYGALLLLNLDNFKSVNDTLGHAAGDALLQKAAARLAAEVGEGDTVARVDRDEFVVLLEELAPQPLAAAAQAKALGLKMMRSLSGSYALSGGDIHVGCSVGATILAGHRQTSQDLLRQANIALHQAKKAGRNALRFFDPGMQESVNARAALEAELRNSVAASQFVLHYQVQVDESRRELGAEALLRWNHPERGLVSPAEFIALAEETHLILAIGQWVIDAACEELAVWSRAMRTRELSLAVNVSSLQFQQPDFAVQVLGSIRRHGADARRLKLELTETMLQGDIERTVSTMNVLKAAGVQFSLDDFGTGYSSLQYLKQLPLDQLKIDRSFVHDIAVDVNDRAIVTTIVAIADHLGLDVIAEGVETLEQLRVLRECGCTRYQGYFFGRPVAAERLFEARTDGLTG